MTTISLSLSRILAIVPAELRQPVAQRFEERAPLLLERLSRLYSERGDFDAWFVRLMESLARMCAARPQELRELDAQRAGDPGWFLNQHMLGYCAYVDRFGGTLRGVAERIPHLCELGVTYLHLLPFLRARAGDNDGGFAVASYDDIESRLGTVSDLEDLTAQLRQAGISLCSDFVLNHVADDHAWAIGAANGDARLRDYFYIFPDREVPDRFEKTLVQIFPQAAPGSFTWSDALEGWVWTTFYPYQWDLNYSNPAVFAEMALALMRLANRGIEVFRLDSTAFLWKREGTDGMNQPEAHWILQAFRAIVDIFAPGVLLKAEAIVPTRELPAYFGESADSGGGKECHLAYHSSLMAAGWVALAEQDTSVLKRVIDATPALPPPASWLTYVRCHDDIGWKVLRPEVGQLGMDDALLARVSRFLEGAGGYANGVAFQTSDEAAVHGTNGMTASLVGFDKVGTAEDAELALRRLVLLYSLALCFGGLPVVYMGDELAMSNDTSEACLAAAKIDSRWVQRPMMDPPQFASRHDSGSRAGKVFAALRRMAHVRGMQEVLAAGVERQLVPIPDSALLVLKRGESFALVANFSEKEKTVGLANVGCGPWLECLTEECIDGEIRLAPWQAAWLKSRQQKE